MNKYLNFFKENTGFLIRIDDIAENMNWDMMDKCEKLFDQYEVRPVLGVIPFNKDKDLLSYPKRENFWEIVRRWKKKGWDIAMHGFTHVYDNNTNKKDFFSYGGRSEFFGHSLEKQKERIEKGLKKFQNEGVEVKSFFAPNHTYDENTFEALKINGITQIIDGYGLIPYEEKGIKFIPQLFYKTYFLPFGIQSTQIHLNSWNKNDYLKFESLLNKKLKNIITLGKAVEKVNSGRFCLTLNKIVELGLKSARSLNFKS